MRFMIISEGKITAVRIVRCISCEAKTYECGIMVYKNDDDSILYLSCNDEMITFLGDSVFHSNTTNFKYVESALIFKDRKNREVKITK